MQELPASSFTKSQPSHLTRNLPSSIRLFDIAQLCFQHCQSSFQPAWSSSKNWVPLQGCGSFCLQRCTGRGRSSSSSTCSADPERQGPREGWQQWGAGPLGSQQPPLQNGTDPSKCTSPEPLMCTQSARSQAGNMVVLGYFTKRSGIYELLKSAHGLK